MIMLNKFLHLTVIYLWFRASDHLMLVKKSFPWQLELKLGLGGTSYEDFIRNMHLPMQLRYFMKSSFFPNLNSVANSTFVSRVCFNFPFLNLNFSQVDPIVASFSGGAVGVISALMLIEANNVEQQEKKRCKYCHGTGMF